MFVSVVQFSYEQLLARHEAMAGRHTWSFPVAAGFPRHDPARREPRFALLFFLVLIATSVPLDLIMSMHHLCAINTKVAVIAGLSSEKSLETLCCNWISHPVFKLGHVVMPPQQD